MTGKRQSNENVRRARRSDTDLGQREAKLEKASEEKLRHMEGGDVAEFVRQQRGVKPTLAKGKPSSKKRAKKS